MEQKSVSLAPKAGHTREDLEDLKDAFKLFESEEAKNSGRRGSAVSYTVSTSVEQDLLIEESDLMLLATTVGRGMSQQEASDVLAQCTDPDGTIDFPQLIHALNNIIKDYDPFTPAELRKAFKVIDKDQNGYLTVDEVQKICREVSNNVELQELDAMFAESAKQSGDGDGSGSGSSRAAIPGQIDIDQFIDMMTKF